MKFPISSIMYGYQEISIAIESFIYNVEHSILHTKYSHNRLVVYYIINTGNDIHILSQEDIYSGT